MADGTLASIAVQIDQKTMQATIERVVLQEIASKLGDPGAYFERIVQSVTSGKVDHEGRQSSYGKPLIEHLADRAIKEFAKKVIEGWLQRNSEQLAKAIEKSLQKNIGSMAKVMADHAASCASWGRIEMFIKPKDN